MLQLEVIQEWIHVQDYMMFIMEENRMWEVQTKETFDIWTSNVCTLKLNILKINVEFMLIIRAIMLLCQWECGGLKKKFKIER